MDWPQRTLCTRKTEIALKMKFHLDFDRVYMARATNADQWRPRHTRISAVSMGEGWATAQLSHPLTRFSHHSYLSLNTRISAETLWDGTQTTPSFETSCTDPISPKENPPQQMECLPPEWPIFNPFTPKSDQCQISPAALPEILHHTVWRACLFITYSHERWL